MTTAISLRFGACLLAFLLFLGPAVARENRRPKFGPYAVPLVQQTGFIRQSPAKDYWHFSQYYLPQRTTSACALASTAMALNFLRGTPKYANQTLITQNELLHTVFTGVWAKKVAKGGAGVRFNELVTLVKKGLRYYKLQDYSVEVIRPADNSPASLAGLRQALTTNETSADDLMLAYFNQGVLTSDWDGPHVTPIGAYDRAAGQVLIMDVDRDWYVPYWSPEVKLLEALLRPAPAAQGVLAGAIGGLVWIRRHP